MSAYDVVIRGTEPDPAGRHATIGDERACRFIEQLWQYDQIVFDATA
jgi:hypothetical protein